MGRVLKPAMTATRINTSPVSTTRKVHSASLLAFFLAFSDGDGQVTAYEERVYELCKRIPAGKVATYGELARALNSRYLASWSSSVLCDYIRPAWGVHRTS